LKKYVNESAIHRHGRRVSAAGAEAWPLWIFIHDTDKVEDSAGRLYLYYYFFLFFN